LTTAATPSTPFSGTYIFKLQSLFRIIAASCSGVNFKVPFRLFFFFFCFVCASGVNFGVTVCAGTSNKPLLAMVVLVPSIPFYVQV
jgi:hypothetical protein